MYSLIFIAKNNVKKKKGNVAVLLFLIALATLLLYISLSILGNMDEVLEQARETGSSADYFYITPSGEDEKLTGIFTGQDEVEEFEKTECYFILGLKYRKEADSSRKEFGFILETLEGKREIGRLPDKWEKKKQYDSILLPYYLKADGSFREGDTIFLTLGDEEYRFTVLGFAEDPLFTTPINSSVYKCYITQEYMDAILNAEPSLASYSCHYYKVRLKAGTDSNSFEERINVILAGELPKLADSQNISASWESMKSGNATLSGISMGVMLAFSILLIAIALIIVQFNVRNFIEENRKNLGVLQAGGYTTGQLRLSLVLEMAIIALVGLTLGFTAGGVLAAPIGNIQASMIGLPWKLGFDWRAAGTVSAGILLLVLSLACLVSRRYGKVTVLDALRGGIRTHNFRKNYLSLAESPLPVSASLGIKGILNEKIKNVSILFIAGLMSFTVCVGFGLYQNFVLEDTNLLKLIGIDVGTAYVTGNNLEKAGQSVEGLPETEKVLYYAGGDVKIMFGESHTTVGCDMWDSPEKLEHETVLEGRLPKYDNEIMLTAKISESLGAKTGDVIYVQGSSEKKEYIVSGIDQKMNNLGRKAMMTLKGAQRLNGEASVKTLYVFAREGYSYQDLQESLNVISGIDSSESAKQTEELLSSITMGMELLCVIFVIITLLVISMTVILLVKTKLLWERRNYGVYKALGYTTGQLMGQTLMSNLPVILCGAILGAVSTVFLMEPLMTACLSFSGIRQCTMAINPLWILIAVIGITVLATAVSLLCSLKIRKIKPVEMLSEE